MLLGGRGLRIITKPCLTGEMLLYESLKIVHGRPEPFQGEYFDNIFVHFKPAKIWYKTDDSQGLKKPLTKADLV